MNKEILAYAIGTFIEKYHNDVNKVKLPEWEFVAKQIYEIKVTESSLIERSTNLWTFEATAEISKTDKLKTVSTKQKYSLIGSADITPYKSCGTNEQSFDVKFVTITVIEEYKYY